MVKQTHRVLNKNKKKQKKKNQYMSIDSSNGKAKTEIRNLT